MGLVMENNLVLDANWSCTIYFYRFLGHIPLLTVSTFVLESSKKVFVFLKCDLLLQWCMALTQQMCMLLIVLIIDKLVLV